MKNTPHDCANFSTEKSGDVICSQNKTGKTFVLKSNGGLRMLKNFRTKTMKFDNGHLIAVDKEGGLWTSNKKYSQNWATYRRNLAGRARKLAAKRAAAAKAAKVRALAAKKLAVRRASTAAKKRAAVARAAWLKRERLAKKAKDAKIRAANKAKALKLKRKRSATLAKRQKLLAAKKSAMKKKLYAQVCGQFQSQMGGKRVLDAAAARIAKGAKIQLWQNWHGNNQKWCAKFNAKLNRFQLAAYNNRDLCLATQKTGRISFEDCNAKNVNKLFYNPKTQQIEDSQKNCYTAEGNHDVNGVWVHHSKCSGANGQKFKFMNTRGNRYYDLHSIMSKRLGMLRGYSKKIVKHAKKALPKSLCGQMKARGDKVIDAAGRNTNKGAKIGLWKNWNGANQHVCLSRFGKNMNKFKIMFQGNLKRNLCFGKRGRRDNRLTNVSCNSAATYTYHAKTGQIRTTKGNCLSYNRPRNGEWIKDTKCNSKNKGQNWNFQSMANKKKINLGSWFGKWRRTFKHSIKLVKKPVRKVTRHVKVHPKMLKKVSHKAAKKAFAHMKKTAKRAPKRKMSKKAAAHAKKILRAHGRPHPKSKKAKKAHAKVALHKMVKHAAKRPTPKAMKKKINKAKEFAKMKKNARKAPRKIRKVMKKAAKINKKMGHKAAKAHKKFIKKHGSLKMKLKLRRAGQRKRWVGKRKYFRQLAKHTKSKAKKHSYVVKARKFTKLLKVHFKTVHPKKGAKPVHKKKVHAKKGKKLHKKKRATRKGGKKHVARKGKKLHKRAPNHHRKHSVKHARKNKKLHSKKRAAKKGRKHAARHIKKVSHVKLAKVIAKKAKNLVTKKYVAYKLRLGAAKKLWGKWHVSFKRASARFHKFWKKSIVAKSKRAKVALKKKALKFKKLAAKAHAKVKKVILKMKKPAPKKYTRKASKYMTKAYLRWQQIRTAIQKRLALFTRSARNVRFTYTITWKRVKAAT